MGRAGLILGRISAWSPPGGSFITTVNPSCEYWIRRQCRWSSRYRSSLACIRRGYTASHRTPRRVWQSAHPFLRPPRARPEIHVASARRGHGSQARGLGWRRVGGRFARPTGA